MSGKGFQNDETGAWDMGLADRTTISYGSTKYGNTLISYTGRLAYAYKDRYLLTATARYDGSSRFGDNNKWGFFPSVGLGWRVSEESFLKDNKVISNLKLRASLGITGNQEIGNYRSLAQLKSTKYIYEDAMIQGFYESIGNPDLKWERTRQFDVGIELSLWNRLDVNFDYYSRRTSDLLYDVPIPSTSGFATMLSNIGVVSNKGFELSLSGDIVNTRDWNISATVNLSKNKNRIEELYNGVRSITIKSGLGLSKYLKVGESLLSLYALKSEGIISNEEQLKEYRKIVPTASLGDEMYADTDGDKAITARDEVNIGETEPNFFYGTALNVQYKRWTLNVLGQGAHNFAAVGKMGDVINSKEYELLPDYKNLWYWYAEEAAKNTKESLFECQFGTNASNWLHLYFGVMDTQKSLGSKMYHRASVSHQAYGSYRADDARLACMLTEYLTDAGERRYWLAENKGFYGGVKGGWLTSGPGNVKFYDRSETSYSSGNPKTNFILIRYADVLLNYAEAENYLNGPSADAYEKLNLVHQRSLKESVSAGMSQKDFDDAIYQERAWELIGEGQLYFDELRTNRLGRNVYEHVRKYYNLGYYLYDKLQFVPQRSFLWKIPQTSLDSNPALEQNPDNVSDPAYPLQ